MHRQMNFVKSLLRLTFITLLAAAASVGCDENSKSSTPVHLSSITNATITAGTPNQILIAFAGDCIIAVKDASGNPITGVSISVSGPAVSGAFTYISPLYRKTGTFNTDGTYTFTLTGTVAGQFAVAAKFADAPTSNVTVTTPNVDGLTFTRPANIQFNWTPMNPFTGGAVHYFFSPGGATDLMFFLNDDGTETYNFTAAAPVGSWRLDLYRAAILTSGVYQVAISTGALNSGQRQFGLN